MIGVIIIGRSKYIAAAILAAAFSALPLYSSAVCIKYEPGTEVKTNSVGKFSISPTFRMTEDPESGETVFLPKYGDITRNVSIFSDSTSFPEVYDMREHYDVTPVKNQGSYGTCWVHSAIASAESGLSKYQHNSDLSEFHSAFYTYYGEDQMKREQTPSEILNIGGTSLILSNLWSQWIGPVNEDRLKYGDISFFDKGSAVDALKYKSDYHLKNAYLFDYDDDRSNTGEINDIIKQFVYNGNAVGVSFQSDSIRCYSDEFFSSRSNRKPRFASHSVAIVGWDDNFSKENFRVEPDIDGAWLVKNSWGEKSFMDGYMWLSYDDLSMCEFSVFQLEDVEDHTVNFHHDTYVPSQSMAAGDADEGNSPSYMANIFTADEDVQLDAVSTNIINPDTEYEITIYSGLTDASDPTSGTASVTTKGIAEMTGIVTIDLDESVIVSAGETFSAVVKLYNEKSPFVIPIESCLYMSSEGIDEKTSLGSYTTYERLKANTAPGESMYSEDGKTWYDITDGGYTYTKEEKDEMLAQLEKELFDGIFPNERSLLEDAQNKLDFYKTAFSVKDVSIEVGNISLKVLGSPVKSVKFSHMTGVVPVGEAVELSYGGDREILYSINGGELTKYTEPISVSKLTVVRATVDGENFTERSFIPSSWVPEKGDVNADGAVDASDASLVLMHYASISTGRGGTLKKAIIDYSDVNNDGTTDASDAGEILKIYAERSTKSTN